MHVTPSDVRSGARRNRCHFFVRTADMKRGGAQTQSLASDEVQTRVHKGTMGRYQGRRVRLVAQLLEDPKQPTYVVTVKVVPNGLPDLVSSMLSNSRSMYILEDFHLLMQMEFGGLLLRLLVGVLRTLHFAHFLLGTVQGPDSILAEQVTCFDNAAYGGFGTSFLACVSLSLFVLESMG